MEQDQGEALPDASVRAPIVLVEDRTAFRRALDDILSGEGPLAVDAERASGFRYSSRAYLVQVHRRGSANFLIDPLAVGALDDLTSEFSNEEWIIHAAHQDLPSLREIGVEPGILFDTELGARLAGLPRVGLQGVVEDVLGLRLAKEHSAADWSTRPLPEGWLTYAALDVELLPTVRDEVHRILIEGGKWDIAREEFQHQLEIRPSAPRSDPWRRLSGLHQLRTPRQLAVARQLWQTREELAQATDTAPGRLVPDRSIVAAVLADPLSKRDLASMKDFTGKASRSHLDLWWDALVMGRASADLPTHRVPSEGPPPPRVWSEKNSEAWSRLEAAKAVIADASERTSIPAENLLTPDVLRRLCWEPPELESRAIEDWLRARGARAWQISLLSTALLEAFVGTRQQNSV